MKKLISKLLIALTLTIAVALPVSIVVLPHTVHADFTATENFDSYANGDQINTKNGGSGWTNAWNTFNLVTQPVVSNTQAQSGSLSLLTTGAASRRDFSTVTVGSLDFWLYIPANLGDTALVNLQSSTGQNVMIVKSDASNNIAYYDGTSFHAIVAEPLNRWFKVTFQLDQVGHSGQGNWTVDGTNTGWVTDTDATNNAQRFTVSNATSAYYIDSIGPTSSGVTAATPFIEDPWWFLFW